MSRHLPVPSRRSDVALPSLDAAGAGSAPSRLAHARKPGLEQVTSLSYASGLLMAGGGRVACLWDVATREIAGRIVAADRILSLWLAKNRSCAAVASGSRVTVHEVPGGTTRFGYDHDAQVTSVHIDATGALVASADATGRVVVRTTASGEVLHDLRYPPGELAVFLHYRECLVVESSAFCTVASLRPFGPWRTFRGRHGEQPPEGNLALPATLVSQTGSLLRWFGGPNGDAPFRVFDLQATILSIDISDDSEQVLAATAGNAVHLFGLGSGALLRSVPSPTIPLKCARFGPDASIFVAGGEALVMHLVDDRHTESFHDETAPRVAMALTEDRSAVLVSDRVGGISRVGLHDGRRQADLSGHHGSVSVVVAREGRIVSGAWDGTLRTWRPDGTPEGTVALGEGPVQAIAIEPGGDTIWAGTWRGNVAAFDARTLERKAVFSVSGTSVRTLCSDTAPGRVLSGDDNGQLKLLDATANGRMLARVRQRGPVYRALLLGNSRALATAADGVAVYDARTLEPVGSYPGNGIRWFDVAFGKVYSLSLAGVLTVFDEDSGALVVQAGFGEMYNHRSVAVLREDRILLASADGLVRVLGKDLGLVATLELPRRGFLWQASEGPGRPDWLHTDREDLVDVIAPGAGSAGPLEPGDPRRARHLALRNSAAHVMQLVAGTSAMPDTRRPELLRPAGFGAALPRLSYSAPKPSARRPDSH